MEIRHARAWYEDRSPLAASAFARELAEAIERIAENPKRYPMAEHGTRRFILSRFPFKVIYRGERGYVTVVAIAHHRRRPGYWRDR